MRTAFSSPTVRLFDNGEPNMPGLEKIQVTSTIEFLGTTPPLGPLQRPCSLLAVPSRTMSSTKRHQGVSTPQAGHHDQQDQSQEANRAGSQAWRTDSQARDKSSRGVAHSEFADGSRVLCRSRTPHVCKGEGGVATSDDAPPCARKGLLYCLVSQDQMAYTSLQSRTALCPKARAGGPPADLGKRNGLLGR